MSGNDFKKHFEKTFSDNRIAYTRFCRFVLEFDYMTDGSALNSLVAFKPSEEQPEFVELLTTLRGSIRPPEGSRRKVWERLFVTVLKPVVQKPKVSTTWEQIGYLLGLTLSALKALDYRRAELMEENEKDPSVLPELFEVAEDFGADSGFDLLSGVSSRIQQFQTQLSIADTAHLHKGLAKGSTGFYADEKHFKNEGSPTIFYFLYLLFEKEIRRLKDVDEIFDFMGFFMGDEFSYNENQLESFRTMCSRVGIRGNASK